MKYDLKREQKAYWNIYFFNVPSMERTAESSVELKGMLVYQHNFHMLTAHYVRLGM